MIPLRLSKGTKSVKIVKGEDTETASIEESDDEAEGVPQHEIYYIEFIVDLRLAAVPIEF